MAFTWHESSHIAGFDWRLVFIKKDNYVSGPQARDNFENDLSRLLVQQTNLGLELDNITRQSKPSINSCWKMKLRSRPTLEESLQVDHPCNSYTPEEKLPTATNLYTFTCSLKKLIVLSWHVISRQCYCRRFSTWRLPRICFQKCFFGIG